MSINNLCIIKDKEKFFDNNENKSITFIGMPGSGKSTIAKQIKTHKLVELDQYIEEKHGKTLFELLKLHGEDKFKEIEEEAILEIKFDTKKVISPGGSVIYCEKGMKHLQNKNNLMVYLKVDFDRLVKRTNNFTNRGIVFNGLTPIQLYEERNKLYEEYADIIIDTKDYSAEFITNFISVEFI